MIFHNCGIARNNIFLKRRIQHNPVQLSILVKALKSCSKRQYTSTAKNVSARRTNGFHLLPALAGIKGPHVTVKVEPNKKGDRLQAALDLHIVRAIDCCFFVFSELIGAHRKLFIKDLASMLK